MVNSIVSACGTSSGICYVADPRRARAAGRSGCPNVQPDLDRLPDWEQWTRPSSRATS